MGSRLVVGAATAAGIEQRREAKTTANFMVCARVERNERGVCEGREERKIRSTVEARGVYIRARTRRV